MIILKSNEPWPTYQDIDEKGAPIRMPRPLSHVLHDARSEWVTQNYHSPTHLIIPLRLRNDILSLITPFIVCTVPTKEKGCELCGFKVVWVPDGDFLMLG